MRSTTGCPKGIRDCSSRRDVAVQAFGLIERFSEDIDLVVHRDGLGFEGERDPTVASNLSNKKRAALFKELRAACSGYIRGDLQAALTRRIDEIAEGCHVDPDKDDVDQQTLSSSTPTCFRVAMSPMWRHA